MHHVATSRASLVATCDKMSATYSESFDLLKKLFSLIVQHLWLVGQGHLQFNSDIFPGWSLALRIHC